MGKSVLKHLDLFSGYGGFTISAQKQGWDIIGFSEIDKYASAVLELKMESLTIIGKIKIFCIVSIQLLNH